MIKTVGVLVRRRLSATCRAALALSWFGAALALAGCSAGAPSAVGGGAPPVTVTIASAENQTGEDGTVSFTVTADPAPAADLQVEIRVTGTGTDMDPATVTATIEAGQTEVAISVPVDLSHGRTVTAEMVAGSGYTVGDASSAEVAVEAVPMQVAPPEVKFGTIGLDSIEVTWTAPDTSLTITGYGVRWRTGSGEWSENETVIELDETRYTIAGLTPNTEYEVQVRARFDKGVGAWSQSTTDTTHTQSTTETGNPDTRPVISIDYKGIQSKNGIDGIVWDFVSDRSLNVILSIYYTVSEVGANNVSVSGGTSGLRAGETVDSTSIPINADVTASSTVTISIDPKPEYRLGNPSSVVVTVDP